MMTNHNNFFSKYFLSAWDPLLGSPTHYHKISRPRLTRGSRGYAAAQPMFLLYGCLSTGLISFADQCMKNYCIFACGIWHRHVSVKTIPSTAKEHFQPNYFGFLTGAKLLMPHFKIVD